MPTSCSATPPSSEQSIRSIYAIAERIVVVYDEAGLSWTNRPLPIEHCLSVVDKVDGEGKVDLVPGHLHDTGLLPLDAETLERNAGIAALGDSVDWVVQIDTDEVIGDPGRFAEAVARRPGRGQVRPRLSGPVALRARGRPDLPRAVPPELGDLGQLPGSDGREGRHHPHPGPPV